MDRKLRRFRLQVLGCVGLLLLVHLAMFILMYVLLTEQSEEVEVGGGCIMPAITACLVS